MPRGKEKPGGKKLSWKLVDKFAKSEAQEALWSAKSLLTL
jgi:hypothetical protein